MRHPDELKNAIISAAVKLVNFYNWRFEDDQELPRENGPFIRIMLEELEPIFDHEKWKKSKIAALKAELKALEKS